jgi:hypothetical protein
MIHQPESDPATPALRQGERVQIHRQVNTWLAAGNTITVLPPCLSKRYEVRYSEADFRLVER